MSKTLYCSFFFWISKRKGRLAIRITIILINNTTRSQLMGLTKCLTVLIQLQSPSLNLHYPERMEDYTKTEKMSSEWLNYFSEVAQ